jgi:large subunit ribosomal protein L3|tara:strand:- start:9859 stop:10530 length:672 start_codon:yes stop_codon:yes gene_type:complete
MKLLVGRKLNMTQLYGPNGNVIPVTTVKIGTGVVTQVKNQERDGYTAVQMGFSEGSKNINKPMQGHVKNLVKNPKLRELRDEKVDQFEVGQKYDLTSFEVGDTVAVSGVSKGKGFQGVVKRHGFSGADASHGTKHHERAPGSIGATDPARVFPGKKMPGRMGGARVTVKNLEIAGIDKENNLLMIKGAVPGARNGLVEIRAQGDMSALGGEKPEEKKEEAKKE